MSPEELFDIFKQKKIVVLGDVMIDAYINGGVQRVSPEAPVPIVNFKTREERLGGAANVALNLTSLGATVTMATVIGKDKDAERITHLFEEEGIKIEGVVYSDRRQTTIKTRVIGNHQQLLRIDQEQTNDIYSEEEELLLNSLEELLKEGQDAIIMQDYNKGVLTPKVIDEVIKLAKRYEVFTTVDPKLKNFLAYQGVTLFKPNLKELSEGVQMEIQFSKGKTEFELAIQKLKELIHPEILFVTLSEHGVYIEDSKQTAYIPAHKRTIHDVSGAGDTVISVATLCLCAGIKTTAIAAIANLAGGIVCEYPGVVAINRKQLLEEAKKLSVELV